MPRREQGGEFFEQLRLARNVAIQTNVVAPQQFADGIHRDRFRSFMAGDAGIDGQSAVASSSSSLSLAACK